MPIYIYGAKALQEPVHKITQFNGSLVGFTRNLFETLANGDGVGLAANQVGLPVSMFVVDLSQVEGHEDEIPVAVINPEILSSSEETVTMEEGCLSIPGIREDVSRPESIMVRFTDGNFETVQTELTGYFARVFLHEYDHLRRKFFVDRLSPVKRQLIKPKLAKVKKGDLAVRYPVVTYADEGRGKSKPVHEFEIEY